MRQLLQGMVPASYWTALECHEDGAWSAYTPGLPVDGGETTPFTVTTQCHTASQSVQAPGCMLGSRGQHATHSQGDTGLSRGQQKRRCESLAPAQETMGACESCHGNSCLRTTWLFHAGMTIAGSRSAAYFEAQRRIAVTIRNMYEVGQRVPPLASAMSLSAAQAWDSSHREVRSSSTLHSC